MASGDRNKLLTAQSPVRSYNSDGEAIITWTDELRIWCKVAPITAREQMRSQQLKVDVSHIVTTHYSRNLRTDWRFMYVERGETRYLNIIGIVDVEERHEELEIACGETRDA